MHRRSLKATILTAAAAAAVTITSLVGATDANIITNGGFDTGTTGWTTNGNGNLLKIAGVAGLMNIRDSVDESNASMYQCIEVEAGSKYRLSARRAIFPGGARQGSSEFHIRAYQGTGCEGIFTSQGGFLLMSGPTNWTTTNAIVNFPGVQTAKSFAVFFNATKHATADPTKSASPFLAYVDDISLTPWEGVPTSSCFCPGGDTASDGTGDPDDGPIPADAGDDAPSRPSEDEPMPPPAAKTPEPTPPPGLELEPPVVNTPEPTPPTLVPGATPGINTPTPPGNASIPTPVGPGDFAPTTNEPTPPGSVGSGTPDKDISSKPRPASTPGVPSTGDNADDSSEVERTSPPYPPVYESNEESAGLPTFAFAGIGLGTVGLAFILAGLLKRRRNQR